MEFALGVVSGLAVSIIIAIQCGFSDWLCEDADDNDSRTMQ